MSGLEIAGLAIGAPALVPLLIKVSLKGYGIFQNAQFAGRDIQRYQYELTVMCVALQGWERRLKDLGGDLGAILGAKSLRYKTTLDTLARIAGVFAEVDQLNEKYGITCESQDTLEQQSPLTPQSSKKRNRRSWLSKLGLGSPSATETKPIEALVLSTISAPSLSKDGRLSLYASRSDETSSSSPVPDHDKFRALQNFPEKVDLEVEVPGLDVHIAELERKASGYHKTLTNPQRYTWAVYNRSKLEALVTDLKYYTSCLEKLTEDRFKAVPLCQQPVEFDHFTVPFVPSHPLTLRFCGREDELANIETYLCPTTSFANGRHPRLILNLHGMGGIGKSQLARYYIEVSKRGYTAVLWVHGADSETVDTSARRILKELIAHYATKYSNQLNFGNNPETLFQNIATDLGIPGQIDSSGEPRGATAEKPWGCVRNWLAREDNLRWCLVFDSVDTEANIKELDDLIPPCTHGHVIITSRLRVPGSKILSIPGLDQDAAIKLLLGDGKGDETAAGKVANMLGHFPIALSQAAAYITHTELNLTQYLNRLEANRTQLLGTSYSKYPDGVFSCWKLSVEALMASNPHAIDLLRVCSFLSPDGVSEQLLHRGVGGIDWAQNKVARLDKAVDDLVTYSLMTRKPTTACNERSFWIHPLVRLWAKSSYSNAGSVTLGENEERLADIYAQGAREAICLVGLGLTNKNTVDDWKYERENVAHFNLCIHRYLLNPKQTVVTKVMRGQPLDIAIKQLRRHQTRWFDYKTAADIFKLRLQIIRETPDKDPTLELEILSDKTVFIRVCLQNTCSKADLEHLNHQLEEISQKLQLIQPIPYRHLLELDITRAAYQQKLGNEREALEIFQKCLDKASAGGASFRNRNIEGCVIGLLRRCVVLNLTSGNSGKAEELICQFFGMSAEGSEIPALETLLSDSPDSWTLLLMLFEIRWRKGDLPGGHAALEAATKLCEAQYVVGHRENFNLLGYLVKAYTRLGHEEKALEISKRIAERDAPLKLSDP
ncbi:hypothetical protein TWF481_011653 [Arthrobotrys musiformis]|uniref:NB-ARC domain-containing protein n=1 Tax=Arthrobotrys musiformis TaxID=47236 RepID=A0AAV9VZ34_9PEZI